MGKYNIPRIKNSLHFPKNSVSCYIQEVCQSAGFPFQTHKTTTEDGYILSLHRINSHEKDNTLFRNVPILLQHGLWSSSDDWVVQGPSKSLGFILAKVGFDVWLGNTRGNNYSRDHVRLSPQKSPKEYWDFSWHEMGFFDIPAMVDYILKKTGREQLYYIGHSLGTTVFFVMAAERPAYRAKIKAMFALAPVVYLRHMRNRFLQGLAVYNGQLLRALHTIGLYKFLPQDRVLSFVENLWTWTPRNAHNLTNALLKHLSFYATEEVQQNLKTIIISHMMSGTSFKVLAHFAQCTRKDKDFRKFDYGPEKNKDIYGCSDAPVYDLKQLSIPIVGFYSQYDWLTDERDLSYLMNCTNGSVIMENVNISNFNHLDFIWADIPKFSLFPKLIQYLYMYEKLM